MKKIFLASALLLGLGLSAQKTIRDANAVVRSAKGFHAIEVSSGIDLYLTQGKEEAVAVSASDIEYRDKIKVIVEEGVLKIFYEHQGNWSISWGNRKLKAYVSVINIDKLKASGGADVFVDNEIQSTQLSMHISGGSDFRGKMNATNMELTASGGSDAYISGRAENLTIHANGGSDVHGYDLISDYCKVESSGGSDVHITVNKQISGNASGGSDVYYKGNAISNAQKSGGSGIKKM
jgi:hypothetical protein